MVGIRQASLYYHFAGKDEILAELLRRSVRPTTDKVEKILAQVPPLDYETALYLLVLVDVRTLADVPHNVGMLYQLPDVAKCDIYDEFRSEHDELSGHYARLAGEVVSKTVRSAISHKQLGDLLIQMVEGVINMRTENPARKVPCSEAWAIAASALRICGVDQAKIDAAAPIAIDLLPQFMEDKVVEPA